MVDPERETGRKSAGTSGPRYLRALAACLGLARNEGMNPCSSANIGHYSSFHVLFRS